MLRPIAARPLRAVMALLMVVAAVVVVLAARPGAAQATAVKAPSAVAVCPGGTPGALVCIPSNSPRSEYTDANGVHHCLPTGPNNTFHAVGDYPNMWYTLADPDCDFGASKRAAKGDDGQAVRIVHKQVKVDADFQAGTESARTVTFTGLPAYVSSGAAEVSGNNSGGVPDSLAASVTVAAVAPTNGQTTRAFVVTPSGFSGSEAYALDLWVLVTA